MNTNNVKKYAPKARKAFIDAMSILYQQDCQRRHGRPITA